MAGQFEVFTDAEAKFRFRLVGNDGAILVISRAFEDIESAAAGIRAVRECAGTGLITQDRPDRQEPGCGASRTRRAPSAAPSLKRRHAPAA